jgi:hypothetical protein
MAEGGDEASFNLKYEDHDSLAFDGQSAAAPRLKEGLDFKLVQHIICTTRVPTLNCVP